PRLPDPRRQGYGRRAHPDPEEARWPPPERALPPLPARGEGQGRDRRGHRGDGRRVSGEPPKNGEGQTVEREFHLINKYGLHARPATLIAQSAKTFKSEVSLIK